MQRVGMRWLLEAPHPEYGYPLDVWETTRAARATH